ncbi:beta-mannosidase [Microlunatus endophyticus]|uniref:beta-mannosidase n=2 Tax=Microlunatus endophyticus TaxID=1716077 RepID=A0A917SAK4_9ACTN|nr:beta-mannosidase [Microlunatus endophyticus]
MEHKGVDMARSIQAIEGFEVAPSKVGGDRPETGWIPAVVPGGVHESLLAAGQIEHPYADRNEQAVRWVEERDWWFRTTITGPEDRVAGDRIRLVLHGLDTVADLWLDGELLGHHENMFRPAIFDLTDRLETVHDHELVIRFSPPLAGLETPPNVADLFSRLGDLMAAIAPEQPEGDDRPADGGMPAELPLATLRRKATFSWGWDFGPRAPSIGIWRPVELITETEAAIEDHHVRTDAIIDGAAEVTIEVEVDAFRTTAPLRITGSLVAPSGATTMIDIPVTGGVARETIMIDNAELWWTHDLDVPNLYAVRLELRSADSLLDSVDDQIGLRTIALDRSEDPEGGRMFRFVLNGVPIFARGAAWLPASMLVGSVSPQHYRKLVGLAQEGGMTMLRIWGGGIYEHDAFYRACDVAGVLVWQDFMFACVDYPSQDETLAREIALEADFQVRRLRNRASIALWSGNNEVQVLHGFAYQNYDPGNWGWDFFYKILPETVERLDPTTPYWPGSPWGEDEAEGWMAANGVRDGDRHAWEVWHGLDMGAGGGDFASVGESRLYRRYAADKGKFISEFGIHASPELATLERWIPRDQLAVHSQSFDAHNKDNPKNKHDPVLEIVTGLPQNLEQYVDFTMASQAEGLKFGIEHYRRRQPHCSGTLIWQFNDVWPGFSWSVVDHDLVPKASYYFARRAYAPVLASFLQQDGRLELWLSNSGGGVSVSGSLRIQGFDGTIRTQQDFSAELAPGDSRVVWTTDDDQDPGSFAWVEGDGFPTNRLFFGEIKDVPFGPTGLTWTVTPIGPGSATVEVESQGYAYFVHLPSPHPEVRFSDNYFDLPPGGRVSIAVQGPQDAFMPDDLVVRGFAGHAG